MTFIQNLKEVKEETDSLRRQQLVQVEKQSCAKALREEQAVPVGDRVKRPP